MFHVKHRRLFFDSYQVIPLYASHGSVTTGTYSTDTLSFRLFGEYLVQRARNTQLELSRICLACIFLCRFRYIHTIFQGCHQPCLFRIFQIGNCRFQGFSTRNTPRKFWIPRAIAAFFFIRYKFHSIGQCHIFFNRLHRPHSLLILYYKAWLVFYHCFT